MELNEAENILNKNGFLIEKIENYEDFRLTIWNMLKKDAWMNDYPTYSDKTYLELTDPKEIDNLIKQYWEEDNEHDLDMCLEYVKVNL